MFSQAFNNLFTEGDRVSLVPGPFLVPCPFGGGMVSGGGGQWSFQEGIHSRGSPSRV